MTKPEELARSIAQTYDIPRFDQQHSLREKLETALKPLLDAGQELLTIAELTRDELGPSATWRIADATGKFGEQLSQWRKK